MVTIFQIAPVTIKMLRTIPKDPSTQLKIAICLGGFLMSIHMKHGYAKVIGTATPPINPAKLGKNGSATAIKHAKQPNRILNPVRSHHGQAANCKGIQAHCDDEICKLHPFPHWQTRRALGARRQSPLQVN